MNSTRVRRSPRRGVRAKSLGAVFALLAAVVAFGAAPVEAEAPTRVVVAEGESIQAAIDAANGNTKIVVEGDHTENVWINKSNIKLQGASGSSMTMPEEPMYSPCSLFGQPATLVCVSPDQNLEAPPTDRLNQVTVEGLELNNPIFDGVGVQFTNNVRVRGNTIANPGCDGIFVIFAKDFWIENNTVTGADCAGINAQASTRGRIQRNQSDNNTGGTGINLGDTSDTVVSRNSASGNCFGIVVIDGPDQGFGIQEAEFAGGNNRLHVNTTNGNNNLCPFGFDGEDVGANGILSMGASDMTITSNTANDNVTSGTSLSAAGIAVTDFSVPGEEPFIASNLSLRWNTAIGNSSADGPRDINLVEVDGARVRGNTCDYSEPDPNWCKGQ